MNSASSEAGSSHSFRGLGIAPKLLDMLDSMKLVAPTPIQHQAIPQAIEGKDVIGVAQTGTGKTLAFGIPLLQRLAASNSNALILAPTRELALQISETLAPFGKSLGLSGVVLIGGASMNQQMADLRRKPRVIIATPGRLLDHMQGRSVKLDSVSIFVLDEADRMLDMGFWPQIRQVLAAVPQDRQTMLFSATLSREIMDLATKHMKTPTSIEVAPPGTTADRVSQEFYIVRKDEKMQMLESVLAKYSGSTIVFTRTKHGAKRIAKSVRDMGHLAVEIHANRSLAQRREALDGFKTGRHRVLVATDIAARGIDVKGVELVVNYDIPMSSSDYVHRIGRTARAGSEGHAISFAEPNEKRSIRDIERLIRKPLRVSMTPSDLPPRRVSKFEPPEREERSFRGPRSFGSPHKSFGAAGRSGGPSHGRPSFSRGPRQGGSRPARPSSFRRR